MRKIGAILFSAAIAVGMLFLGCYVGPANSMRKAKAQTVSARPNIIFILTDDMRYDDLAYMPRTRALLQRPGMSFKNAFVSTALCAPSRATIMRGQYAHNTGVRSNSGSIGGWRAYRESGNEVDNVATRLQGAGYKTGFFGKYMNGYKDTETYIPPGWNRWFATHLSFFGYDANDQGNTVHFGTSESDYQAAVLSRKVNAFITNSASSPQPKPFFAYVAPKAPHLVSTPAPDDAHDYDGIRGPRLPSFNENVSDKPPWIRQLPSLTPTQIAGINKRHERRVESLQAVDDMVEGVVDTLRENGAARNTYIFFTSDNGFHHGEHRIPAHKWRPYEEDMHVPLLVRGPGVQADSTYKLALDTDYLPTFMELAGAQPPPYVDGRSLVPVLRGDVSGWRNAVLLEATANHSPAYRGVRTVNTSTTTRRKYVEYAGGEREFYRLLRDPYELTNRYDAAAPPTNLASRLDALRTCAANARPPAVPCRAAEGGR